MSGVYAVENYMLSSAPSAELIIAREMTTGQKNRERISVGSGRFSLARRERGRSKVLE